MAPRKPVGKTTHRGKAAKVTKKVTKPAAKTGGSKKAKALVKSATKALTQAKKPVKAAKRGRPAKSPTKSAKTARRSARSPSKTPAKSPSRTSKSPSRSAKSSAKPAKSPSRSSRSPGRPAKSPVRSVKPKGRPASPAKSPGRPAKSPVRSAKPKGRPASPAKSPGRPAKSATSPAKSPARPAKSTGRPVKSPGRAAVKSSKRSPKGRASATKGKGRSGGRSAKTTGKPTSKSRAKTPKEAVKRLFPESSPAKKPAKVVATLVSKKSPRGKPVRQSPTKVEVSSRVSPAKTSPRKVPVARSPEKKQPVSVKSKSVSPVKKSQTKGTAARSKPSDTLSPRKRATLASSPPAKKVKEGSAGKELKGVSAQTKVAFTPSTRPTRTISRPARLRDAAPEKPVVRRKTAVAKASTTKASPTLKLPPKPTRVVPTAETRPSRADMTSRRDAATKGKQATVPAKQSVSSPRASTRGIPEKKVPQKGPVARTPILKTGISGSRSTDKSGSTPGGEKPTPKRVTIVVPPKESQQTVIPSSPPVSHPCKHCSLVFRSRSDAELHEHRCSKNESRSDKRYPCNKCNGMFTMSDLILHKKQAHPQRDTNLSPVKQTEGPQKQATSLSFETPAGISKLSPVPSGGFVFKLPKTTDDLGFVIRKAVEAAANAGLVPANKKIVITSKKTSGASDPSQKRKPSESITVPAKKRKVTNAEGQGAGKSADSRAGPSVAPSTSQTTASSTKQAGSTSPRRSAASSPARQGASSPARSGASSSPRPGASSSRQATTSSPRPTTTSSAKQATTSSPGQTSVSPAAAGSSSLVAQQKRYRDPKETVFTCLDCGDVFPSRREVSDHKAKCPGVGKTSVHACMDCNMTFMTRIMLNAHKREVHVATKSKLKEPAVTVRSYKCSECELFFPVDSEVKKHIQEIHGGVGQSTMCNVVATPEDLRSRSWTQNISNQEVEDVITHIVNGVTKGKDPQSDSFDEAMNSPPPASPPVSPRSYSPSKSPVRSPAPVNPVVIAPIVESGSSRSPGQCLDCFMRVNSRLELAQHKRFCQKAIENRQLFCFDCSSSFKSYFDLSRHKHEVHMGEAHSLKCLPCGAVYSTHAEWREHCKTHQVEDAATPATVVPARTRGRPLKGKLSTAEETPQKAVVKETTKGKSDDASREQQPKGTRPGSTAKKAPVKTMARKEPENPPREILKTRSGRVVQKKQDEDMIVEKVVRGRRSNVATADVPMGKTLGTIEIIQSEKGDIASDKGKKQPAPSPRKRPSQAVQDKTDKVQTRGSPQKRSLPASEQKEQSAKSRKRNSQSQSSEATPADSVEVEHMEISHDEGPNISLANGLISISADKANDYQIFVDAKQDGSSIQVKLIRNEDANKEARTPAGTKVAPAAAPPADKPKTKVSKPVAKEVKIAPKPAPTPAQPAKKSISPKAKSVQSMASKKDTVVRPADTTSPAPSKPATGNAPTDMGKVVQKGKPFVIGGQTLVPIQFPPGYQVPGGATGGQKVFAIPSTNLPPGLLQLLAKQNKGLAPQPAKQKPAPSTSKQAGAPKQVPEKMQTKKIPSQTTVQKSPQKSAAAVSQEAPASLKGMTGAQLMARAQARILGRPLPPLIVDGPIPPFKTGGKKASAAKNAQAAKTPSPAKSASSAKGTQSTKSAQPPKNPAKNSAESKAVGSPTAKKVAPAKPASPARKQANAAAGEGTSGTAASDKSKGSYQDPLFVYQCTSCKKNFKSTAEINKHMNNCPAEGGVKPRRQRSQRQKGTDVWHMKPVSNDKGQGRTTDADGVEWFVASKNT